MGISVTKKRTPSAEIGASGQSHAKDSRFWLSASDIATPTGVTRGKP